MRSIGNKGEDQACKYLINNGYTIKKQNYYTRFGELDINCSKRDATSYNRSEIYKSVLYRHYI